ncbi:hypothetical protein FB384_001336 [Prauserella sediminis]|uniref:Uncharacterized protein n=1 Tax=Prauserella sediminis TaxID=577680 RepID=A0A839XEP6_9PSEU|nr:hypothetical protein [Prauserella sediminis]
MSCTDVTAVVRGGRPVGSDVDAQPGRNLIERGYRDVRQ